MSSDTVETTAYMVVTPTFSKYRKTVDGEYAVESVKATKITQTKPKGALAPGAVVIKVKIRLPKSAFMPLAPSVVIDIPEDAIERLVDIVAEVDDEAV